MMKNIGYKKTWISLLSFLLIIFILKNLLPDPLFNKGYSRIVYSQTGEILSVRIAKDQQWRFPINNKIPKKFEQAITCFEDEYFYYHPGFNPISIFKALASNISKRKRVRGASTISMQCIRLSRNKARSYLEKFKELFLAISLELNYSKSEILELYATHAPFGGNIVGLEAASWRYFNCSPEHLSWAEAACLAVLPNSPALIHPGRNRDQLLRKRNFLLKKLLKSNIIDRSTYQLAILEPIPEKPRSFNHLAPHLLLHESKVSNDFAVKTTLDLKKQIQVQAIADKRMRKLEENQIHNCAVLVTDVQTRKIVAYVGNYSKASESRDIDNVNTKRSVGSVLKPLLYGAMMDKGILLPKMLVKDVPININGFAPKNYSRSHDGVVSADEVISRSLNVPSVLMLRKFGIGNFHNILTHLGLDNLYEYKHYGLGLILGGVETSVWNISNIYTNLAHQLKFRSDDFQNITYKNNKSKNIKSYLFNKSSLWFMFQAMKNLKRPDSQAGWENFSSSSKIAWKTGTSFGFRDAWAVGVSSKFVVTVWVGNSNTVARPLLTGSKVAAPILFDVFSILDTQKWFSKPQIDMKPATICKKSGYRANHYCTEKDSVDIPATGIHTPLCPFHRLVHLDKTRSYRVNSSCYSPSQSVSASYFVLPPVEEWYYKKNHPSYQKLPEIHPLCKKESRPMEFIYPKHQAKLFIPIDLDNKKSKSTFEIAHRKPNSEVHWHIDNQYIGSTKEFHQMEISAPKGKHKLIVIDDQGSQLEKWFEIVN